MSHCSREKGQSGSCVLKDLSLQYWGYSLLLTPRTLGKNSTFFCSILKQEVSQPQWDKVRSSVRTLRKVKKLKTRAISMEVVYFLAHKIAGTLTTTKNPQDKALGITKFFPSQETSQGYNREETDNRGSKCHVSHGGDTRGERKRKNGGQLYNLC